MKLDELKEYDTVMLSDGRIGIIIEMAANGKILLEQRQQDFERGFMGDSPIFDTTADQVIRIVHDAEW